MRTEVDVTIVVEDTLPPVIELITSRDHYTNPMSQYEEEGYVARDNYDGILTEQVIREEKNGVVIYTVTDSSGNTATVERVIVYKDMIAPRIQLMGETKMYLEFGNDYMEPGFLAIDNADGDITSKVKVKGTVNTDKKGWHSITYTVKDSFGNETSVTRKVYVYDRQSNSGTVNPGDKVIYLTFDDGPSQFTKPLLEILDAYGVKATFFVSGQSSQYRDVIGEIYRSGHTVGLHTYSHKYNEIYSSTDTYYKDLELIHDIVYEQTGEKPWLIRFPGGTGNSISKRYCSGIMTSISQGVSYRGYLFCDWNVDSQDAIGTYSRSEIASNVIKQIKGKNIAYVLQHDLYKESVEAVEEIICWGLSNGYTFLPLEKDSPMIHQTLKN
jgi:peptidoglycan/xylan/chitin deacetylase (PgdA/CDA1 family)